MERHPLPDLAAFVRVAELRSFRKAAVSLGLSPSALSHTLRNIETKLGVRLLHRTTRSVAPTEAGERLLERLRPALDDIDAALSEAKSFRDRPAGRVRINTSRSAARFLIAPRLGAFAQAYPEVRLEIVTDDALADIVAAGCDAGVRLDEVLQPDMVAVRLGGEQRLVVVASPRYLARQGTPQIPADLAGHACFRQRMTSGGLLPWEFERDGEVLKLDPAGPLISDDGMVHLRAALDGAGLAYMFEAHVAEHLAAGELVRVLDDWCAPFPGFFLYYPSRRQVSPALRAFIDHMRAEG
jgi:DNA-binding transcriptional LysR family regulator